MTMYGYARVSTKQQELTLQINSLIEYGIPLENIYTDKLTGTNMERESLKELLEKVQEGDVIVVKKLDRLGRSVSQVTTLIDKLSKRKIWVKSITDNVDTSNDNPMSKAMFQLLSMFAEMERNFMMERTQPAIQDAMARGVKFGRPEVNQKVYAQAVGMYVEENKSVKEIINHFGTDSQGKDLITEATLFRRVREYEAYQKAVKSFKESNGTKTIEQLIIEGGTKGQKNPQPILTKKKLEKVLKEGGLI